MKEICFLALILTLQLPFCIFSDDALYPEIELQKEYSIEKEDPEHHYGPGLAKVYPYFIQENPQKNTFDFLAFIKETNVEIPKVTYLLTPEDQQENIIHIDSDAKVLEDLPSEKPLMFVMDIKGNIYAHEKIRGSREVDGFHHSSFTGASKIAFAGTIKINSKGFIEWLSDDSGHYKPLSQALVSLLMNFEKKGISLEKIQLSLRRTTFLVSAKYWLYAYQSRENPIPGENVLNLNFQSTKSAK
jgi:hypothetical protein